MTSTSSRPRLHRAVAALTAAIATAAAGALLPFTVSAASAAEPDFLSSFESADPQPSVSSPYGPQVNLTGSRTAGGSLLGSLVDVTASAENGPGEVAEMLADGDKNTKWLAFQRTGWIVYELDGPHEATGYRLTSGNDAPGRDPRSWTIEGSADGAAWTTLDTQTDQTFSGRGVTREFPLATTGEYTYYRLSIVQNNGDGLTQLADWDIFQPSDGEVPVTPMTTVVGSGPISGYNMKPGAGFNGTAALRYGGGHVSEGGASGSNVLYDVDIEVEQGDQLSYVIFPVLDDELTYSATFTAIDLVLDGGERMSALGLRDVDGFVSSARSYGEGKVHYGSQWNSVRVDLSSLAGRTIDRILLSYDNPTGGTETSFTGWVDDIRVAQAPEVDPSSLVNYVDTRRGTLSSTGYSRGNNIPATAVPNGFNFFTPMTDAQSDGTLYRYAQENNAQNLPVLEAIGISHETSPWMGDRNQVAIMPSTASAPNASLDQRGLAFQHANEIARPDLYSVQFENNLVTEVTPTDHGGVYRFQFPGETGSVLFDTVRGDGAFTPNADGTLTGWIDGGSGLSVGRSRMFVYAEFDTEPTAVGTATGNRANARYAAFAPGEDGIVELRIATSFISLEQAERNFDLEVDGRSFDEVRSAAATLWNDRLDVLEIEGATVGDTQRTTLYSNLYRLNLYPNSQFENVGTAQAPEYAYASPVAPKTGTATATQTNAKIVEGKIYVNNGFWDTYRTVWPAYSLLYPEIADELVDGFVQQYRDGGWVSRWSSPGYADLMTGTSSDAAFAEAYVAGALDSETALDAYDAALKNATVLPPSNAVGRKGLDQSIFFGYTPEPTHESVSWALEGFINDYGIGQMAAGLAEDPETPDERRQQLRDDSEYLLARATQYVNQFDPETGFFRPREQDGSWHEQEGGFDPRNWGYGYTETNAWNFAFHAPFDVEGLADLHGGIDGLHATLDEFYSTPETGTFVGGYGGTIHEMLEARDIRIGQLGYSNQVSHHIPYIAAAAGDPATTQSVVREILQRFSIGSDIGLGYAGDEDNGETSAWWILSSLGIYPLALGSGEYTIGSPQFERAVLNLENGGELVVEAPGNDWESVYVESATFNGQPIETASISQELLLQGGTLRFEMSDEPTDWAAGGVEAAKRTPLVDATRPAFGETTSSDETDATNVVDDNSRSQTEFATAMPTLEWTSASGPVTASTYTITNGSTGDAPTDWTLQASADGETWVTLDERSGEEFRWATQTRPFPIDQPGSFEHYRIAITATAGGAAPVLAEIELLADPNADDGEFQLAPAPGLEGEVDVEFDDALATLSGGESEDAGNYTATVDYLDGEGPQPATLERSDLGRWLVVAPHTFDAAGTYSARVTVTEGIRQATTLATIDIRRDQSLTGAFDSICITDPGLVGDCDELQYAFIRSRLAESGFVQGQTNAVPGTELTFDLPAVPAGEPDNATGRGQTIAVDLGEGATQLSVIGTGTQGDQREIGVMRFSDGTSQEFPIDFGDWTGGSTTPRFGNIIVGVSEGRQQGASNTDGARAAIYATAPVTIPEGKEVVAITLPLQEGSARDDGRIHVFAFASDGVRTAPEPLEVTGLPVAGQLAGEEFTADLATATGGAGDLTATVHWGDGTATTEGVVTEGTISGTHTYEAPGEYEVTVTVDDGMLSQATTTTITVEAPAVPVIVVPAGAVEPGATVTVTGSGFDPGEQVTLTLSSDPEVVVTVQALEDGTFTADIVVPTDAEDGSYPLVAVGAESQTPAQGVIAVESAEEPPADPTLWLSAREARPGDLLAVEVRDMQPGEAVRLVLNSTPVELAVLEADAEGFVSGFVRIPSDAEAGNHVVTATGVESELTASADLRIVVTPAPGGAAPDAPGGYDGLGSTGPQNVEPTLWIGVLALLAGALAVIAGVLITRRRNRTAE